MKRIFKDFCTDYYNNDCEPQDVLPTSWNDQREYFILYEKLELDLEDTLDIVLAGVDMS